MTLSPLPAVEAQGLERRYGRRVALAPMDVTISPGEVVLVAGPNGAGKSTLLRMFAGLARPSHGRVRIFGHDLYAVPAARARVGFLSHQTLLYDDLTAQENLRFAAALHRLHDVEHRVRDALDTAGLADRADTRVGDFSRGMLQRLALARSTLHEPSLLLLDEPFTGLDRAAGDALRRRVAEYGAERAVVCVSHEPGEVWDAITRVLVLHAGRLRVDAPRPDTLQAFSAAYAAATA